MGMRRTNSAPSCYGPPRGWRQLGVTLVAAILGLLLLLLLVALIASAVWTARGAAKRATCTRNLEKLVAALQTYAEANGGMPPAAYETEDPDDDTIQRITWKELVEAKVSDHRCFICPADATACEAEKSRPPESRSTTLSSSYEYVYQRQPRQAVAERPRASDARSLPVPSQAEARAAVLLCSHHDTPEGRSASWCLIAYDDGSVAWERTSASRSQAISDPAPEMGEISETSTVETAPPHAGGPRDPSSRGGSGRADGMARRSGSTAVAPARAGRDRRSR
jgi:hypothetical protein